MEVFSRITVFQSNNVTMQDRLSFLRMLLEFMLGLDNPVVVGVGTTKCGNLLLTRAARMGKQNVMRVESMPSGLVHKLDHVVVPDGLRLSGPVTRGRFRSRLLGSANEPRRHEPYNKYRYNHSPNGNREFLGIELSCLFLEQRDKANQNSNHLCSGSQREFAHISTLTMEKANGIVTLDARWWQSLSKYPVRPAWCLADVPCQLASIPSISES